MISEKLFKQREDVALGIKQNSDGEFSFFLRTGPKTSVVEQGRVIGGDFELNKNKYYIAYVAFRGDQNILRVATVPEKGGIPEYVESYLGSFYKPKIVFHQGEQLIFAHMYTDKSKLVCFRRGVCYDVSAGGSNHLTGLVDMGDCLVAAVDCDHYLKQEEKINGGQQPFDAFGIEIMRKPAMLVYHLNSGIEGGVLKADADAFVQGGAQLVRLARKGKKFFGAYMRFERNTYVLYVTDFGESWKVCDTCRIVRDFTYKIKGGKHILEFNGQVVEKTVEGGCDIDLAAGKPCGPIRLSTDVRQATPRGGSGFGYYWGDTRVRTNISICSNNTGWHCGSLDEKYMALRHLNGYDFCAISDHDTHHDKDTWDDTRFYNDLYNLDHNYAVLNAYEWRQGRGVEQNAGHYNVLFRGRGDVMRGIAPDSDVPFKLSERLQNPMREGMMIVSHPNDKDCAIDWNQMPGTVVLTEMFGARGSYESMDCPHHPFEYKREVLAASCVSEGLQVAPLGFVGGGGHECSGSTCVLADALTREAIYDALSNRRCYATTGARIIVEYEINGVVMGGIVRPAKVMQARIFVQGTDEIIEALLMTDQGPIPLSARGTKVDIKMNLDPFMYAYVRILQRDGQAAWSSPIFMIGE
ncbi:MAG: DUF3604 domain-containing protein [Firmicutes bacterium]|nr:DUF3604 domain-containing protein [Bacillota bacterium]